MTQQLVDEAAPATGRRRVRITWADQIEMRPVVWAWEHRIPAGSLSTAAGREGTGKSTFGIWLAAAITRGELPGAWHGEPRRVLYVAVEDSWAHTIAPRLAAAGADLTMVGRVDVVSDEDDEVTLSLPADNVLLEATIREHHVALVVIDPLMSVISEKVDTHREREVRTALDPLARLADRTGAILLGIAHFNKGASSDASSLITGSGAFKNVPRSIFGFIVDDQGERPQRLMTQTKNSLGRLDDLPSLAYGIEDAVIPTKYGPAHVGRLVWMGETERTVQDVLRDARTDVDSTEERSGQSEAAQWLKSYLADNGGEADVATVLAAGRRVGFNADRLNRAKKRLRIVSRKEGMDAGWTWVIDVKDLAEDGTKMAKAVTTETVSSSPSSVPSSGALCLVCGQPLDPTMAALGEDTHAMCIPSVTESGDLGGEAGLPGGGPQEHGAVHPGGGVAGRTGDVPDAEALPVGLLDSGLEGFPVGLEQGLGGPGGRGEAT